MDPREGEVLSCLLLIAELQVDLGGARELFATLEDPCGFDQVSALNLNIARLLEISRSQSGLELGVEIPVFTPTKPGDGSSHDHEHREPEHREDCPTNVRVAKKVHWTSRVCQVERSRPVRRIPVAPPALRSHQWCCRRGRSPRFAG